MSLEHQVWCKHWWWATGHRWCATSEQALAACGRFASIEEALADTR